MLNHWSPAAVVTEYRKYAGAKARALDEAFMRNFNVPGMLTLLKSPGSGAGAATGYGMLPTPPSSDRDGDVVEDDAWAMHICTGGL